MANELTQSHNSESPSTRDQIEPSPLVRELLRQRGVSDDEAITRFMRPNYDRDLGDPSLMLDMDKAVARLRAAIATKEKVAVYGDYDIDGIVSTALLLETLERHGLEPVAYIPDRYTQGYGLHHEALAELKAQGVTLVITVDCGITGSAEARWATEQGLDLVITDHHEVPPELPVAVAVINPRREGDEYPFKELAGVGVAFALTRALQRATGIPATGQEKWLLDLVALGTVCDVMPLVGENRTLVSYGLVVLRKTRRVGLVALAQSAGVELEQLRAYHLGFSFGPRLNAAGRLAHANYSLELVTTSDPEVAQQMAFQLEELNHQRRLEQARMVEEADALAADQVDHRVLVVADASWPHGVVGIVASKLSEKWQKPTLVLQILEDKAKGSGRSFGGYNLIEGLRTRADLFERLGGHHHAAGFTLPTERVEELRRVINEHHATVAADLPEVVAREADIVADDSSMLDWNLLADVERLEPFGQGNTQPAFGLSRVKVVALNTMGQERQHLKLRLAGESGVIHEAVGFGLAERYPDLHAGQVVNVVCYLQKNQFNGRTTLQLMLLSIQQ